jgi:hypothetical protein
LALFAVVPKLALGLAELSDFAQFSFQITARRTTVEWSIVAD